LADLNPVKPGGVVIGDISVTIDLEKRQGEAEGPYGGAEFHGLCFCQIFLLEKESVSS